MELFSWWLGVKIYQVLCEQFLEYAVKFLHFSGEAQVWAKRLIGVC